MGAMMMTIKQYKFFYFYKWYKNHKNLNKKALKLSHLNIFLNK